MVTRADSTGLGIGPVASLGATQRLASATDTRSQQSFDQFTPASFGKLFKAEVLSSLTDGSFTVQLDEAGTTLQMNLPAGTQVGDKLELTLIGNQPRPTFSIPADAETAVSTSISEAGKLIDDLLHTAQSEGAPTTLIGKAAVVTSPDAPPTQVATALKNTLAYSGLFYESHVSQWASGERPLSELMREPQAQFSDPKLVAAAVQHFAQEVDARSDTPRLASQTIAAGDDMQPPPINVKDASMHSSVQVVEAELAETLQHVVGDAAEDATPLLSKANAPATTTTNNTASDVTDVQTAVPHDTAATSSTSLPVVTTDDTRTDAKVQDGLSQLATKTTDVPVEVTSLRADTVNNDPTSMVSLQLETLEHQRIMWQGEVWPGQHMQWEISEDSSGSHGAVTDGDRPWQSTLRVDLPSLGIVSATIRLTGQHVQVQMRAASEHTTSLLRMHGDKLASAMEAAGSLLDLLTVRQDNAV